MKLQVIFQYLANCLVVEESRRLNGWQAYRSLKLLAHNAMGRLTEDSGNSVKSLIG